MSKFTSYFVVLTTLILLFGCVLTSNSSSLMIASAKAATPQVAEVVPRVTLYPTSTTLRRGNGVKIISLTGLVESVPFAGGSPYGVTVKPNGPKATACPVFAGESFSTPLSIYPVGSLTLNLPLLEATTSTPLGTGNCGLEYTFFHRLSTGYTVSLGVKTVSISYTVKDPR